LNEKDFDIHYQLQNLVESALRLVLLFFAIEAFDKATFQRDVSFLSSSRTAATPSTCQDYVILIIIIICVRKINVQEKMEYSTAGGDQ